MASQAVINLVVDASNADNQINAQVRRIVNDAERRAPAININVVVNNNQINNITNQVRRLGDQSDDTNRRAGGIGDAFKRIGSMAGSLGAVAGKMGTIGVAAAGAVPAIAATAAGLAELAPASAAGATAILGVVAATATLKIGMQGVGDAVANAFDPDVDPEDFAAQLKTLAPEARRFVLQLQKMSDGFKKLQLDVQNRLFKDFDDSLKALGKETMPVLEKVAKRMADSFNSMATGAADAAVQMSKNGTLGSALEYSTDAMRTLEKVPADIVRSLLLIAEAGGPVFGRLANAVARATDSIAKKLAAASKSGGLEESVNRAADAFVQLGRVAGNIGEVFGNVFEVAQTSGAAFFDTLENITGALAKATGTQEFADALGALIGVFQTISSVILPLFQEALGAILPVLEQVASPVQMLIKLLGDQLVAIMPTVSELLAVVAEAFAELIRALAPIIDLILELVAALLPALIPLFTLVADILRLLTPILTEITGQLADAFLPVIEALIPIITILAEIIGQLAEIILPVLAEIIAGQLLPIFVEWFAVMAELLVALAPLIEAVLKLTAGIIEALMPALSGLIQGVSAVARVMTGTLGWVIENVMIPAIRLLTKILTGDFSGAWDSIKNKVSEVAGAVGRFVGNMVKTVQGLLKQLVGIMLLAGANAFKALMRATVSGVKSVVNEVKRFPGRAKKALGNLGSMLVDSGKALIRGFIKGIKSMVGSMVSSVKGMLSKARNLLPFSPAKEGPFSGRGWTLYSGQALIDGLMEGIHQRAPELHAEMGKALGGLDSTINSRVSTLVSPITLDDGRSTTNRQSAYVLSNQMNPQISVSIGNQAIDKYVDVRIQNNDSRRDRLALQGVRR